MSLSVDTDILKRILTGSLPTGARASELFIESRIGLYVEIGGDGHGSDPVVRAERRWESGAHLRRFAEGRCESFVLDAPTGESLQALALHPQAVAVEWLSGRARLGVSRETSDTRLEACLNDASPSATSGPWSESYLRRSTEMLLGWLGSLQADAASVGIDVIGGASLRADVQEVLVLSTDRDPARDTRSFVDATLRARFTKSGRSLAVEQTRSAASLEGLERLERDGGHPAAVLFGRGTLGLQAVAAPRGEMPVVFAPPSGGFLLHEICGHLLEADHVLRAASPFVGARGRSIASPLLTLADDGSIPGMRGSTLFDDEGIAARRTPLIIEGTLVGYLSDRLTAFATGGISTGNGRRQSYRDSPMPRMTNLVIDPGRESFDEILRRTAAGLLVTRLGRGHVEPATGRFSLAVEEGYLIEGGARGAPVAGAVLRGRASDLLPAIDAVGSDPRPDTGAPVCLKEDQAIPFGIMQPTLRVSSITVAGADR